MEKSLEIDQLKNDLKLADIESKQSQEVSYFDFYSANYSASRMVLSIYCSFSDTEGEFSDPLFRASPSK